MFCNKCGSQVPDGMNFCNNCGNPMANAAPQAPQQPMYQQPPMQQPMYQPPVAPIEQPEPPKKKNTGLIIGIVAGVLAVIVAAVLVWGLAFDGFGLKDKDDDKDEKKDSTTTSAVAESNTNNADVNNQTPETPVIAYDIKDAEEVAIDYANSIFSFEIKDSCEKDIIGWNLFEGTLDKILFDKYKASYGDAATISDMYQQLADESGYDITDAESFIDAALDSVDATEFEFDIIALSSKELSKSEADEYISNLKSSIDAYNSYGLYSGTIKWNDIQAYAEVLIRDKDAENADGITVILGYINNEWKVIHADAWPSGLYSLNSLEGFAN